MNTPSTTEATLPAVSAWRNTAWSNCVFSGPWKGPYRARVWHAGTG